MTSLLVIAAQVAAASFAPVPDRPYRFVTTETRTDDLAVRRTFTADRTLVFHRDGENWIAEVTLDAIGQDAGGIVGERFERSTGALRGRILRFRLDAAGQVRALDEADDVWDVIVGAIARMNDGRPAGPIADPAAALRALSPDQRFAMLASAVTAALAGADLDRPIGATSATLPSTPLAGPGELVGTRTVSRRPDGNMEVTLVTKGSASGLRIATTLRRVLDARTGLIVETSEQTRTTLPDGRALVTDKQGTLVLR